MIKFFISICILLLLTGTRSSQNLITNQKSVKVLSHGSGYTIEEARNNSLINALQVVSGSYVSSNIIVENDAIIKNNINVFTSGSIKSAVVLSKEVIGKRYNLLMSVEVYPLNLINKINKQFSSKIKIEPDVFLDNLRLFKIQSKAEENAVLGISKTYKEIIKNGLSYKIIEFNNKVSKKDNTILKKKSEKEISDFIELELVISIENVSKTFSKAENYLFNNLSKISVSPSEIESLLKLTSYNRLPYFYFKPIGGRKKDKIFGNSYGYHENSCTKCKRIDRERHRRSCVYSNDKTRKMKVNATCLFFRHDHKWLEILEPEEDNFDIKIGNAIVLSKDKNRNWINNKYKGLYFQYQRNKKPQKNTIYLISTMSIKDYEHYFSNIKNVEIIKR